MDKPRFLSGYELVAKGLTKIESSLPEIGLKDVTPNGTWLEQKQIQSLLEARKQLIEVERIEKKGQLSQAEWRDDLKLAQVIKKAGPHWQFLGHNVGKHLYLRPEEALYLIETNCLLLNHNEVTVSLQKAYSLLLGHSTSLIQYKVYASLSRIGYRIIRHTGSDINKNREKANVNSVNDIEMTVISKSSIVEENDSEANSNVIKKSIGNSDDIVMKSVENSENNILINNKKTMIVNKEINGNEMEINVKENVNGDEMNELVDNKSNKKALGDAVSEIEDVEMSEETENLSSCRVTKANFTIDEDGVVRILNKTQEEMELELCKSLQQNSNKRTRKNAKTKTVRIPISSYQQKLQKLKARKLKPLDHKVIEENFSSIPNIYRKKEVTFNIPDEKLLPRNVFLNNISYLINLDLVRLPTNISGSPSTPAIVNEPSSSLRRLGEFFTNSAPRVTDAPQFSNNTFRQEFSREQFSPYSTWRHRQEFPRVQYSPYSAWRPRAHCNFYYPYNNMYIPRSFSSIPCFFMNPQYRFQPPPFVNPINQPLVSNMNNSRSYSANRQIISNIRRQNRLTEAQLKFKMNALRALQNLIDRHKHVTQLIPNASTEPLIRVIGHFNSKYNERLRLSDDFELINDVPRVEVIELDDEETNRSKRRRLNQEGIAFDRNLNAIKGLACKLRELDLKKQCASRHRRALSNVIKKFNKSFNADIYLNKDSEIIDRSFVTLESSSDSDSNNKVKRKRKLRNPFNILKRIKDKANSDAGSSKDNVGVTETDDKTKEALFKHFDKNWVPNDDDFGRPEICTNNHTNSRIIDSREDELVYEFLKESRERYNNWVELKSSFYENLEASTIAIKSQQIDIMTKDFMMDYDSKIKPILYPEDCTDMRNVLDKLRIISTKRDVPDETSLRIDFDVYNRNVQNFRKTNLPNPHFRIICLDETSEFPPAAEVECLLAKYDDNIPLVFAIVGFGSSVSYLQIKPSNLDVYIPNDLG